MSQALPARIADLPMPPNIARLPRNSVGYPVPWFVATIDGKPDFRVVEAGKIREALQFNLCWICGKTLGRYAAFLVGPMCAVNRTSGEPPSHRDCARYAAVACPFLAVPGMARRTTGLPEDKVEPAGMIHRNPGVALVWTTLVWGPFRVPNEGGVLFTFGQPTSTEWFAHGREATREEVLASMESGLPLLRGVAAEDGPDAVRQLGRAFESALGYAPAVSE